MPAPSHPVPVEVIRLTLERAAHDWLDDDPHLSVALQLVSSDVRRWLLPIIYQTFSVMPPGFIYQDGEEGNGGGRRRSRLVGLSMNFLRAMMIDPDAPPRRHIRHIVFYGRDSTPYEKLFAHTSGDMKHRLRIPEVRWEVNSIAIDVAVTKFGFALSLLHPTLIFQACPVSSSLDEVITSASRVNQPWPLSAAEIPASVRTLRIRLLQIYFDNRTERISEMIQKAISQTQSIDTDSECDSDYEIPSVNLVLQIEPQAGNDGSEFFEQLAGFLPLMLKLAALHCEDVVLELPSPVEAPTGVREREPSAVLKAVELHLRAEPAAASHHVSVQYRDATSGPHSLHEYIRIVRNGSTL